MKCPVRCSVYLIPHSPLPVYVNMQLVVLGASLQKETCSSALQAVSLET